MIRFPLAAVSLGLASVVVAAETPRTAVKASDEVPPAELTDPVRVTLDRKALAVTGVGEVTLWFRSVIPVKATAEQVRNGLTYREIPGGTLLGAVRFAKPFVDFRKQEIPAGVYTLRFALQPETGDHAGTSPHPEFALLCPAVKDQSAEPLDGKALYKLSSATTGGDHPGVIVLFPAGGKDAEPKLVEKRDGVTVLTTRRPAEADDGPATLGFALAVAGHSKSR